MRGAVEVIELPGPASGVSGLFGDENGEELDFQNFSSNSSTDQGLSKHQEVCFTPVTKMTKMIVIFWDLLGVI